MAKSVAKGVESAGAEVKLFQVPETLTDDVLGKMHAPAKDASIPVIQSPDELETYDGIIFGTGTRSGSLSLEEQQLLIFQGHSF
jgi:NAD(P)H dehydrogenase (quinone)